MSIVRIGTGTTTIIITTEFGDGARMADGHQGRWS